MGRKLYCSNDFRAIMVENSTMAKIFFKNNFSSKNCI
uniref:Uncharacterized protein n=1 Tax=Arundo donax TaxID=35708 RepID=A0A0A9AIJ8_ARUDO